MSSTYVSDFYAAALRRTSGFAYVMFFETCESNVFPRTPHWSAQYVSSLPEVLSHIVEYVDCCEGGMTKGARGQPIRPETFVRRSEEALGMANLITGQVTLDFGKSLYSIPLEKVTELDVAVQRAGIPVAVTHEGEQHGSNREFRTLDLSDPAVVDALLEFQREADVPPWRIFDKTRLPSLPASGDWTPGAATHEDFARAKHAAQQHLARHRIINIRHPWPGSSYVQQESLVLGDQQQVLSSSPMRWFCQDHLGEGRLTMLGQSLAAFRAFRTWMDASTTAVDASACEVEATSTGAHEAKVAEIAEKLTEGRSRHLPARGLAAAVFDEIRYCEAANFTVVTPQHNSPATSSLF
jgi:hypothetical protein